MNSPEAPVEQRQFVDLFLSNQHRIYRFVASAVPQWVETEEIFQQTCLTLWERWDQFRPDGDFVQWACGIAIGHLRNHVRKKQNHQVLFEESVLEQLALSHIENHSQLEELHQALRECVQRLPAENRRIILRCYDGQTTPREAAELEGKTLNVLYKLLRKTRALLYHCITRRVAEWRAT
ncbi:sigma-70 family RNA polymerase sigma factor [Planctomicrobium sp. SH661]|uniref:sigma-70 family RNA polymerase sigma factor n=1 Tax=Planctomicrobium sp. SH661 TaxID=3448124 RepID=UPI003F5C2B41